MVRVTFKVEGMNCDHCVRHVTDALLGIDGVKSARAELGSETAYAESAREIDKDVIARALDEAGYGLAEWL